MTATVSNDSFFCALYKGQAAIVRYYGYLGLMVGAAALAFLGQGGYNEESYFSRLFAASGALWLGAGLIAGLVVGAILGRRSPRSKVAGMLVGWFDGALLMLILTALFALLEPAASAVAYDKQDGFVSARLVMAMNVLLLFSAICYLVVLFAPESFIGRMGSFAAWLSIYAGGVALLLRWYESYLISPEVGHAPVSNLYEVFILLFCITVAIYLSFERRYGARALGAFVMGLVSAGVFFEIWLDSQGMGDIKPLVPALQSYWMKIHVPLNFIGYGAFAVACAAGMAFLLRQRLESKGSSKLLAVFPTLDQLDQLAYKSVAIGFPAFTLATILGAAWAAEAWGGYWSWDPKETWALIVWLVYGAWLHARISHGWSGRSLAWWSVIAFLVTLFCFVGVNLYLSGLHSYGRLA